MVQSSEKLEMATHYRKRGFSYSEIANLCGVSKATVSNWLGKKAFSKKIKQHNIAKAARNNVKRMALVNKARNAERKARYTEAIRSAETEYKHYKQSPLFVAGLTLYFASGDTAHPSQLRLSSNDPRQHRLMIRFFGDYLGVSKNDIRFWLLLPSAGEEKPTTTYWSKQIGLPLSRFGKTQIIAPTKNNPLHNGTGNTIIGNTVLKRKLTRWIELALKELT